MEKTLDMMLQNSENISKEKLVKALRCALECINQVDKCICHEAYKSRDRIDPNCEYCNLSIESYNDEIEQIMAGDK